ncbi:hypothetical protein CORI_0356 [Campylobacter sp. CCUG 57310]|nr:hypothetical protein CORI_0356 [Campylobacter sp. CCUG 57310]
MILIFSRELRAARNGLDVPLELPDLNKFISNLKNFIKTNTKNDAKESVKCKLFGYVKMGGADEIYRA